MVGSISLDCAKNTIQTMVKLNSANGIDQKLDSTPIFISLFGFGVRQEIRNEAERCNELSSSLVGAANQNQVMQCYNGVNESQSNLQSILAWAKEACGEIMQTPGISDFAKTSVSEEIGTTIQHGQETINNSINAVNSALTNLKNNSDDNISGVAQQASENFSNIQEQATAQSREFEQENEFLSNNIFGQQGQEVAQIDNKDVKDKAGLDAKHITDGGLPKVGFGGLTAPDSKVTTPKK